MILARSNQQGSFSEPLLKYRHCLRPCPLLCLCIIDVSFGHHDTELVMGWDQSSQQGKESLVHIYIDTLLHSEQVLSHFHLRPSRVSLRKRLLSKRYDKNVPLKMVQGVDHIISRPLLSQTDMTIEKKETTSCNITV